MAERSNAAVSKTVSGGFVRRGFKSLPLRSFLHRRRPARVVTNGMGAMPSFADQLSEEQITEVAAYVSAAAGAS